ncbi:MAG: alpha-E domain-containing protein [Polyangiaceae bacterium]
MLSRVADAVFWMSRYMERAENVARFIDVNLHLALDAIDTGNAHWEPLVAITGDNSFFRSRYGVPSRENVIKFLTLDPDYGNSIRTCLRMARENARSVREIISSEMWEQVNTAYLTIQEAARTPDRIMENPHDFFTSVKKASQLFVGITYLTMTHNEAWHFGRLGRLLERADKTSRIVDVKYFILLRDPADVGSTFDEVQWAALLKSASGFEMYRKRFGRIVPANVVDFLLFDRKFPRSVRYCLVKAERSLHAITGSTPGAFTNPAEQLLGRLRSDIEFGDVHEAIHSGLHDYIDRFQLRINEVGGAIHDTFFAMHPIEHELRVDRD